MTIAPVSFIEALEERYQVRSVIGEGGMATVYEAHDRKHDRTVALKVLHDDLAASLGPERFKREIRIAARLQHPHILTVHDSGEAAGRLWFTMPYVNGLSLRDLMQRDGKLPLDRALAITREAALALTYAHKQGVIHRDIKPENILLTEDGSTLVADFGIARSATESMLETGLAMGLTQTGSALGTPMYMAPEQATGDAQLDERVDQYALAAVLYEMLAGTTPFTGANVAALMAARFTTSVPLISAHRSDVPADIDVAIRRALSIKPADRFASMAEFAQAVAPALATPAQFAKLSAMRAATPARSRPRMVLTGVTIAVIAAAGWFLAARGGAANPADAGPIRIAVLPFQNLGDSSDAYFADGMADELRGKLLKVPGVEVIARASSVQYSGTKKSPAEIAKELGVSYLLTATVRWERLPDGNSVVHLRPELMQVRGDRPATTRWQQAFDKPLTDVLAMQAEVAQQVATQLEITLGTGARTQIAALPTTNSEAYDAYLRGMAGIGDNRPAALRRRIVDFERAVSLDSTFAEAWARLAAVASVLYVIASPTPDVAAIVRNAAERAQVMSKGGTAGHLAMTALYSTVIIDPLRAEKEMRAAIILAPNDPNVMRFLGNTLVSNNKFAEAAIIYEQAARLDPQNDRSWAVLGNVLQLARRYEEAKSANKRAAMLAPTLPTTIHGLVAVDAALGDIRGARAVIREAYGHIPPEALDVYLATYNDYGWILDDSAQQRVLAAPIAAFDNSAATRAVVRAQIYRARGDTVRSRAEAAKALPLYAAEVQAAPDDPQGPLFQSFAAALAGQPGQARTQLEAANRVLTRTKASLMFAVYYAEIRARIHTVNGDYDKAFGEIEAILDGPGLLARGHLKLDPMWAPLRSLPRYQRIMSMAPIPATR